MTLLELLVVLAIIAVIGALVMPVFLQVRTYSQRTVCASNMRQIGHAMALYVADYDETYPTFLADPQSAQRSNDFPFLHDGYLRVNNATPTQTTWFTQIRPDLHTADDRRDVGIFHCPADRRYADHPAVSYEYKYFLAQGRRETEVEYPDATLVAWEQFAYHLPGMPSESDARAQLNAIFADGHCRFIRLSNTTTARFGAGPNLHDLFEGGTNGSGRTYLHRDILSD